MTANHWVDWQSIGLMQHMAFSTATPRPCAATLGHFQIVMSVICMLLLRTCCRKLVMSVSSCCRSASERLSFSAASIRSVRKFRICSTCQALHATQQPRHGTVAANKLQLHCNGKKWRTSAAASQCWTSRLLAARQQRLLT